MKATKHKNKKSYIFFDESGKPEIYSSKGVNLVESRQATRYLVLCAVRMHDQLLLQQLIADFKARLLRDQDLTKILSPAYTLDAFHAQKDYPQVKEKFYDFITTLDIKIDILVVEKLKCHPSLRQHPGKLYGVMAGELLKNISHQAESTEIIFSRKDSKLKLRQELEAEVERVRLRYFQEHPTINKEITLSYQHNPHYTHSGLQIADYCAFSVFQVYENQNDRWYKIIQNKIGKIQDICNKKYFTKSCPLQLSS